MSKDLKIYKKPNLITYRMTQFISNIVAKFVFKRKFVRNEIKHAKGAYVVIANHESQLDFVNLIGATRRRLTFVISNSFYNSLPIKGALDALHVIPKQQFQTELEDIKKIKAVVDSGNPFVIYPAGLMSENGLSTPIPTATNKFLKLLKADVYVARCYGTYFSMPKWSKGMRSGRTFLDVYKLFSKEELSSSSLLEVKEKLEKAILFDAYSEQEKLMIKYRNNSCVSGLENVLYACPVCGKEFSIHEKGGDTLFCDQCGFTQKCDEFGFFHCEDENKEIKKASDWDIAIYEKLKTEILNTPKYSLSDETIIEMINFKKNKFFEVGLGKLTLCQDGFILDGEIDGERVCHNIPIRNVPCLPFKPGKYIEIQHGKNIYRCRLKNGAMSMKFIHALKIFFEMNNNVDVKCYSIENFDDSLISNS